jgi:hypothetical protein
MKNKPGRLEPVPVFRFAPYAPVLPGCCESHSARVSVCPMRLMIHLGRVASDFISSEYGFCLGWVSISRKNGRERGSQPKVEL